MSPTWRPPDGRQLLFRGQEGDRWGFFLVDVNGGEPVRLDIDGDGLEGGGWDLQSPAWSPTATRTDVASSSGITWQRRGE